MPDDGTQSIIVRYDGLDADQHEIEMAQFAESLQGLARAVGLAANFAASGKYLYQSSAWDVRVNLRQTTPHCVEVWAVVRDVSQHPLFQGAGGAALVALVQYLFAWARGAREEMRHLREALIESIRVSGATSEAHQERLLQTIEKLASGARPAIKQAVAPIGESCSTMTIGADRENPMTLDETAKAEIMSEGPVEIDAEKPYRIKITELDLDKKRCHFWFENDKDRRYPGEITDPSLFVANNRYMHSLAGNMIEVWGKAAIRDGEIVKLFISNAS